MLKETIQNYRDNGLDLDSPKTADALRADARRDPETIKLPATITTRVALFDYLKKDVGLNEGPVLYTVWDLVHAPEMPMP